MKYCNKNTISTKLIIIFVIWKPFCTKLKYSVLRNINIILTLFYYIKKYYKDFISFLSSNIIINYLYIKNYILIIIKFKYMHI